MPAVRFCLALAATLLSAGALTAQPLTGKPRVDRFGDPLPDGALFRIGTSRFQLDEYIWAFAASPDGKLIAASSQNALAIWEVPTGREIVRLPMAATVHHFVAFSPDGKLLALNHANALSLFDRTTGQFRTLRDTPAFAVVFAADGKTVTALEASSDPRRFMICVWDLTTNKPLTQLLVPAAPPAQAPANDTITPWLSADGQHLALLATDAATGQQTVRLHDVVTGAELRRWPVYDPAVSRLAFSPDGKALSAGSNDSTVRVWDTATGKERIRWKTDDRTNVSYYGWCDGSFAPDSASLFSTGRGRMVRWDWRTGEEIQTYADAWGPVLFLNGKIMATRGRQSTIRLFDVDTGKDLCPLPRPDDQVLFSPDARWIAWPEYGAVVVAEARTGKEVGRWPAPMQLGRPLAFTPDSKALAGWTSDGRIVLWEVPGGRVLRSLPHREMVDRLEFSADGGSLMAGKDVWASNGRSLAVWDVASGKQRQRWESAVLAPGLQAVAVADATVQVLRLLDTATGKQMQALPGYRRQVQYGRTLPGTSVVYAALVMPAFSPDGRLLLAAGDANDPRGWSALFVWDVATGKRLPPVLRGDAFVLQNLAFSPDGRLLAAMRSDGRLVLLSTSTGSTVKTLGEGQGELRTPPAFTPDGRTLVTAVGGLIQFWEVEPAASLPAARDTGATSRAWSCPPMAERWQPSERTSRSWPGT